MKTLFEDIKTLIRSRINENSVIEPSENLVRTPRHSRKREVINDQNSCINYSKVTDSANLGHSKFSNSQLSGEEEKKSMQL